MRRILLLVCIVAQVIVLGVMAAERELILNTGKRISLRTAPIDPRDPFRGDFVRLDYDVALVSEKQLRGALKDREIKKGERIYAVLFNVARDLYEVEYFTDEKPAEGIFLRGRARHDWRGSRGFAVNYGIEKLFVEQGRGLDIERRRGTRDSLQIPMEVEIAVGSGGTAVIRGFRWSRLGMSLKMLRFNRRDRSANLDEITDPLSPRLEITLQNVSDASLLVADPGEHCGFQLKTTTWVMRQYHPVYDGCREVSVSSEDLVELGPGEAYTVELDLIEPRWYVSVDGKTGEIGEVAGNDSFRIVYRSPGLSGSPLAAQGVAAERIWIGELPSSAFTAFQVLD